MSRHHLFLGERIYFCAWIHHLKHAALCRSTLWNWTDVMHVFYCSTRRDEQSFAWHSLRRSTSSTISFRVNKTPLCILGLALSRCLSCPSEQQQKLPNSTSSSSPTLFSRALATPLTNSSSASTPPTKIYYMDIQQRYHLFTCFSFVSLTYDLSV
jgi:hypothetical protein